VRRVPGLKALFGSQAFSTGLKARYSD
jgi:hypothetical protein